jgi:hypothetical protein
MKKHPVPEAPVLLRHVRALRRAMTFQLGLDQLTLMLLAVSGVALLLVIAHKLFFLPLPLPWWTLLPLLYGAGAVMALVVSLIKRPGILRASILLDQLAHSRERISTALLLLKEHGDKEPAAWPESEQAVWKDAVECAGRLREVHFSGRRPPRHWKALGVVVLALGLSAFMPPVDLTGRREQIAIQREEQEVVRKNAARVERMMQHSSAPEEIAESTRAAELKKELTRLLRDMQHRPMNRREALSSLSRLEKKVQEELKKTGRAKNALERLASNKETRRLAEEIKKGKQEAARRELKRLADKAAGGELSGEEKKEIKAALSEALKEMKRGQKDQEAVSNRRQSGRPAESGKGENGQSAGKEGNLQEQLAQMDQSMSELSQQSLSEAQMRKISQQMSQCRNGMCGGKGQGQQVRLQATSAGRGTGSSQLKITERGGSGGYLGEDGSTNLEQPGGPGRSWSDEALPPGEYVRLYDPRRSQVNPEDVRARSRIGEGQMLGSEEVPLQPGQEDVTTPGVETFESFRTAAEDALAQEQVPLRYRPIVRQYFDEVDAVKE